MDLPLRCPCCRCKTLGERLAYEICPVCGWEDDGQDDHNADVWRGGANAVSLSEATENYQEFGASIREDLKRVRAPRPEEMPN